MSILTVLIHKILKYFNINIVNNKIFDNVINIFKHVMLNFAIISIIFLAFILYLEVNQLFNMTEVISKEVLEAANESIKLGDIYNENISKCTNKCIFSIFSDLFEKSKCSNKYYPSYFVK